MPGDVTVWFNPRCSKARGARDLLAEKGVECSLMDYQETPPTADEIRRVLGLLGTDDARVLTRTGESLYAELGLGDATNDELIDALAANPSLIERPVVIVGERAVVARPPERLLEIL